jgi:hypothetical protein
MRELNTDSEHEITLDMFIESRFASEYHQNVKFTKWEDFINSKDIGIKCTPIQDQEYYWNYEIIDEKKWNYARIKYEF